MKWKIVALRIVGVGLLPLAVTISSCDYVRPPYARCISPTDPNIVPVHATDRYDDPDAYSVYSVIVPTFPPDDELGVWLILRETAPFIPPEWENSEPSGVVKNYLELNQKAWLLENRLNLPKSYRLVSADELRMSPRDPHWVRLSVVGFNAYKTAAVVQMEQRYGADCCGGHGSVYKLVKIFGKWRVTSRSDCWVGSRP